MRKNITVDAAYRYYAVAKPNNKKFKGAVEHCENSKFILGNLELIINDTMPNRVDRMSDMLQRCYDEAVQGGFYAGFEMATELFMSMMHKE